MAFIQEKDYALLISEENLEIITNASMANRITAENAAMEEMASYLRGRFDTQALFQQTGNARNRLILMYLVDMAVYHLLARLEVSGGVPENRKSRYDAAIAWLIDVADGKSNPELPVHPEEDAPGGVVSWGSAEKKTNNW